MPLPLPHLSLCAVHATIHSLHLLLDR
jgi:hypothetical protein